MDQVSFASGPLYALLHEACYAQGSRPAGPRSGSGRIPEFAPDAEGSAPHYSPAR